MTAVSDLERISPPINDLKRLRTALTTGEQQLLDTLLELLPTEWKIYVQPHLNGLRPDFIVLNANVGIGIFEVKDWTDETFDSDRLHGGIAKIKLYRDEVLSLYCPSLAIRVAEAWQAGSVVTATLVLPSVSTRLLPNSVRSRTTRIIGREDLQRRTLRAIYPHALQTDSKDISAAAAADLKSWLEEPRCSATQRVPLVGELDTQQKRYALGPPPAGGLRRIRGAAGAGKSLILAARAARLAHEGRRGLVLAFNITLLHYLRDLAVRWDLGQPAAKVNEHVTWMHFHGWCKRVCVAAGFQAEYSALWHNKTESEIHTVLTDDIVPLVREAATTLNAQYDFVFVDEGQDFHVTWWNTLRPLAAGGEMLLVADHSQDLFGTGARWTDNPMPEAGFNGDWVKLNKSYRTPARLVPLLQDYHARFWKGESNVPIRSDEQLELTSHLTWIQTPAERLLDDTVSAVLSTHAEGSHPSDITLLVPTNNDGLRTVAALAKKNYKVRHTFSEDQETRRRLKHGFYSGDSRIKATTYASYRGFETTRLIVMVSKLHATRADYAALYSALSRLRKDVAGSSMVVVCADPSLRDYGKTWPAFHDRTRSIPSAESRAHSGSRTP